MSATDILAAYCLAVLAVLYAWHRAHVLAAETAQPCPTCGGRGWLEVWSWVSHEWVRDACGGCIDGRVLNTTTRSHR